MTTSSTTSIPRTTAAATSPAVVVAGPEHDVSRWFEEYFLRTRPRDVR